MIKLQDRDFGYVQRTVVRQPNWKGIICAMFGHTPTAIAQGVLLRTYSRLECHRCKCVVLSKYTGRARD